MPGAIFVRSGNFFFRYRRFLFPAFVIAVVAGTRPAYFLGDPQLDAVVAPLGAACAVAGGLFRMLVIGFAYIKRGGKDHRVYANTLVTEGFYAHVRNPMYIGNFLILVGIGVLYGSPWVYCVLIPFFAFAYYSIVAAEEDFLGKRFGAAYEDYCRRVRRFIPRFRGIRQSLRGFRYDWRKALRKDYFTFSEILLVCYAAWQWKRHALAGVQWGQVDLAISLGILAAFGIVCVTVHHLKGAGYLRSPEASP